jgi:hypothetical protein
MTLLLFEWVFVIQQNSPQSIRLLRLLVLPQAVLFGVDLPYCPCCSERVC